MGPSPGRDPTLLLASGSQRGRSGGRVFGSLEPPNMANDIEPGAWSLSLLGAL